MKIRSMLIIATIAVITVMLSTGMYSYFNVSSLRAEIVDELLIRNNIKNRFTSVNSLFQTCRRYEKDIFLAAGDPLYMNEYIKKFDDTAKRTYNHLTSLQEEARLIKLDTSSINTIKMIINSFMAYKSAVLHLADSDETSPRKLNREMESSKIYIYQSEAALSELLHFFNSYLEQELELIVNEITIVESIVLAVLIISAFLIATTLMIINFKINKGLSLFQNKLSGMITDITEIAPVEWEQADEFKEFSKTINDAISRHKELKYRLHQSEKMEAIGTLAGGIAHDFNNILSAVLGASSLLKESNRSTEDLQLIDCIEQAVKKTTDLNIRLLRFSRESGSERQNLNLSSLIEDSIPLIQHSRSGSVKIKYINNAADDTVFGNYTELQTVILNLGINARDAVNQESGKITIITETEQHSDGSQWVCCSISDNGCGMNEETVNKIFNPFFTTKPKQEGTGLGLSAAYGIVKEHGGVIHVKSTAGKGSCFTLKLPPAMVSDSL